MAIKLNKRKRKHEEANAAESTEQEEGELMVPKKMAKPAEEDIPRKKKKKNKQTAAQSNESAQPEEEGAVGGEIVADEGELMVPKKMAKPAEEDTPKKKKKKNKQTAAQSNESAQLEEEGTVGGEIVTDEGELMVPKKMAKPAEEDTPKKKKKKNKQTAAQSNESAQLEEEGAVGGEIVTDEGELMVPKKMAKPAEEDTPKKKKKKNKQTAAQSNESAQLEEEGAVGGEIVAAAEDTAENVEADVSPDSGLEPEAEPYIKFSKDFKMLHFRSKLRSTNFITELRHLLHLSITKPKIIAKYIEKRGKPLELAEALERVDKTNLLHVGYLCEALQLVVMEILTNQKQHMESAVHACRYFLKAHGAVIEQLLQSALLKQRRVALKLLTAIVCVEPQLGRQVLSSYNILSNVVTMERLLSHTKEDFQEPESVRKCYIHFVLAFLVDGNTLLIRNILERGQLIKVLTKGLFYDDHVTVCVVLNTLRKYVLECPEISKTKKIHVFDLECCKQLTKLYDWLGPGVLAAKYGGKKVNKELVSECVPAEQLEAVSVAVHDFLLVLLTSRKHGVTFDAITHFRQKHNILQGKVIGTLYLPYLNARKTELVLKVLEACPDLARHTMRNFASLLSPLRTTNARMPEAIEFLAKVIATVTPKLLAGAMNKMTLTDCTYWIKEVCLPIETLAHITGGFQLKDKDFAVRMATNRLLVAMLTQYKNYVNEIARREQAKRTGNSLRRFKFDLLNHLLANFPTIEAILFSLFMSIKAQADEHVDVLAHLSITLDLVLIMCQENRAFVHKTSQILNYLDVLRPLYATNFGDGQTNMDNVKLELKAIKVILLLFPRALQPEDELFDKVLHSFIKAYLHEDHEVQNEAGLLLYSLFKHTGLFEACDYEIDLWLEALRCLKGDAVNDVAAILVRIFQVKDITVEMPALADDVDTLNTQNLRKLFEQIDKGLTVQAYVETLTVSKVLPLVFKGVDLTPPYDKYVYLVSLLLFHYYPQPSYVHKLCAGHLPTLEPYMQKWLPGGSNDEKGKFKANLTESLPLLRPLQFSVLKASGKFMDIFTQLKSTDADVQVDLDGSLHALPATLHSQRRILLYAQQVLFIVVQLVAREELRLTQADIAAEHLINLIKIATQLETSRPSADQAETAVDRLLKYIYGIRLSQVRATELFSAGDESQLNYLHFLRVLTAHCSQLANFEQYAANYRLKIIKSVAISLESIEKTKAASAKLADCVQLVEAFNLSAENCMEIFSLLTEQLTWKDYFLNDGKPSVYYELLVSVLRRLTQLQQPIDCAKQMQVLQQMYSDFNRQGTAGDSMELTLEPLESVLCDFLHVYHQYTAIFDLSASCQTTRKLNKSSIKLACLLLERNTDLTASFVAALPTQLSEKKELVYPLLDIVLQRDAASIEHALLQTCYQTFKNGFMKSIEKPQKAAVIYKENVDASIALIKHCMPKSECVDFCNKQLKFDGIEIYQMRVLQAIYQQAYDASLSNAKNLESIFVNFVSLQVQMLSMELKKQALNQDKLELFAYHLYAWLQQAGVPEQPDYARLLGGQQWLNFCKSCLKLGMHLDVAAEQTATVEDHKNGLLLKLLAFLCDRLYQNYSEDTAADADATPAQLFELICSHSRCVDILLDTRPTAVKTQVLHLLLTLARKSPQALQGAQIPIVLGAYQARLSPADRYALALLELYELHVPEDIQQYRPFIWGESAIAFYALRSSDDERIKLQQQETSIAQVLSLIDRQLCEYTIDNFPIWRSLHAGMQLPSLEFENPELKAIRFGANTLEQAIELDQKLNLKIDELRLCPKRAAVYERCYDPAFFVPLMSHCFAPGAYVHPARPVQNGLLALVFTALASQDKDMRLAAANCQQRYRTHFEQSKFFERPLWVQAYENIQAGLSELRDAWMKHKRNSGTPRVPLIPSLFIAKTFNITNDPTHLLYKQLTMYLRLKESFNFQTIPEFNVLFFSPEVEHHEYRQFIVEVIRSGIMCSADLFQLVTTNTFKVLMSFYGSTISTLDINLLILSVFSTCVKIPGAVKIMLENVGVLPWLTGIVANTEFHHFDVIEGLISIINNMWYALRANAAELHNYAQLQLSLHRLILQLLPLISARIALPAFAKLMNILQKTVSGQHLAMPTKQLDQLLDCADKHFPKQLRRIQCIKMLGGVGAESHKLYCERLHAQEQLDMHAVLALSSLRAYVIDWKRAHAQATETS